MNAIEFLKQEHEKAKAAFKEIEQARGEQRRQLWSKLAPELKRHEQLEADCFYGPLASDAGSRDQRLVNWQREHEQQVREAESLIAKISSASPSDPRWMDTLHQLKSALEQH